MSRTTALVLASLAFATNALAGPLTPPAGPVTSTMKTMTEVEPRIAINATNTPGNASALYVISQPGSYYLTGNIVGVAGKHGIVIGNVIDVTIDLNGFRLVGVAGSLDGVSGVSNGVNVTVRNGIINSWGQDGIDLAGTRGGQIENVTAYNNGIAGIKAGAAYSVSHCSANNNASAGISTGETTTVSNCTAHSNTGNGIATGSTNTITDCTARSNGLNGIATSTTNTISGCTAENNTQSGILTNFSSTVTDCTAASNDNRGITVEAFSTVRNCTVRANGIDGIACTNSCLIVGNLATSNGVAGTNGAGIFASSSDNRIEGNSCNQNDFGIQALSTGSIIMKNTCSGNTTFNWTIAAGNAVGPIVQATTNAGIINGNTYAGSLGSTDTNANFTY